MEISFFLKYFFWEVISTLSFIRRPKNNSPTPFEIFTLSKSFILKTFLDDELWNHLKKHIFY